MIFSRKNDLLLSETTVKGRLATQDDALISIQNAPFAATLAARVARMASTFLIAASVTAVAATSFAQTVPVPKPAPKGRDGGPMSTSDGKGPSMTGATQAPPTPIIPDPRRNVPMNIFQTF